MASLRTEAQDVLDVARAGIGWIALWKNGRSWTTFPFYPEITRDDRLVFEDYEVEQMKNIQHYTVADVLSCGAHI